MKAFRVVLIILLIAALMNFVREGGGRTFHIITTLPFAGGHEPAIWDLGGLCLIALGIWGWQRLKRQRRKH